MPYVYKILYDLFLTFVPMVENVTLFFLNVKKIIPFELIMPYSI